MNREGIMMAIEFIGGLAGFVLVLNNITPLYAFIVFPIRYIIGER